MGELHYHSYQSMLWCLTKECIRCCTDSSNFRSCYHKCESSCYQLQLGIHLYLENSLYEIHYGEVIFPNRCMLSCLRKECIHCCTDSGNFHLYSHKSESSCYLLQLGIHLHLENSLYEIHYGEVKLTDICQPLHLELSEERMYPLLH